MKGLKDSILEKLSIDSISEKLSIDSILEKLSLDSIATSPYRELTTRDMPAREFVKYLKEYGFEEKKSQNNGGVLDDVKDFNKYKGRYYSYSTRNWAETPEIVFADTSKGIVSKNNPLYYLEYEHETRIRRMVKGVGLVPSSDFSSIVDSHDILVELKEYFEKI